MKIHVKVSAPKKSTFVRPKILKTLAIMVVIVDKQQLKPGNNRQTRYTEKHKSKTMLCCCWKVIKTLSALDPFVVNMS